MGFFQLNRNKQTCKRFPNNRANIKPTISENEKWREPRRFSASGRCAKQLVPEHLLVEVFEGLLEAGLTEAVMGPGLDRRPMENPWLVYFLHFFGGAEFSG